MKSTTARSIGLKKLKVIGALLSLSACAQSEAAGKTPTQASAPAHLTAAADASVPSQVAAVPTTLDNGSPTSKGATSEAFRRLMREQEASVADLYTAMGEAMMSDESVENLRVKLCAPAFTVPGGDKIEMQVALLIRSRAQMDKALGEKWLKEGVLTAYSREEGANGTFVVNVVWNDEVVKRLAEAQIQLGRQVVADRSRYC
jgi:hypothetical protein